MPQLSDYHFCFLFMSSQFQITLWRPTAMKDVGGFSQVLQECAGTSFRITQWPILSTLFHAIIH